MASEAEQYWQYSRECAEQALEAETPELRDQLLGLVRLWTEAALREEINAKPTRGSVRVSARFAAEPPRPDRN